MLASPPPFFYWHIMSVSAISGFKGLVCCHQLPCPLIHLSECFPCPFYEWSLISYKGDCPGVYSFLWYFYCWIRFQEAFSFVRKIIFLFFLSSPFAWRCPIPVIPSTCNFPFLQSFFFFVNLAVLFLPLFVFFHFSPWARHIFLIKILFLYPEWIFLLFLSEPPLLLHFFVVHVHQAISIFLRFRAFVVPSALPLHVTD